MPRAAQTLLIAFIAADNDLSPYVELILRRLKLGTRDHPNVKAIALVDRLGANNTNVVEIAGGAIVKRFALDDRDGNEVDMGRPETLGKFLLNARRESKAERTIVTLIGHGTGPVPEVEWVYREGGSGVNRPVQLSGFPVTPVNLPMTPVNLPMTPVNLPMTPVNLPMTDDLSGNRTLSTVGLGKAFAAATNNGRQPFDLLFFDQCFQGNLDVLYELRNAATIFIASPNYAWLRASYVKYIGAIAEIESLEKVAGRFVSIYQNTLGDENPNAIFWIRGAEIEPIADAVSELGQRLARIVQRGRAEAIEAIEYAITHSKFVDTGRSQGLYELGSGDELMGANSFARNLQHLFPPGRRHGIYEAAGALRRALLAVHSTHRVGHPYVAPDTIWDYSDAITILAVRQREATNDHAGVWRASLYRPEHEFEAVWGTDSTQQVFIKRNLAYVMEGKWHRFISAWYLNDLKPTLGQPHYVNLHSFEFAENGEALELQLRRQNDRVQLRWRPSKQVTSPLYQIYKRRPQQMWELIAAVEGTKLLDQYAADSAEYRIMLFDEDLVAIGWSEAIQS